MSLYGELDWTNAAAMAIVATDGAQGLAIGVTTPGVNTTGANLIVVAQAAYSGSASTPTLTDSNSNTWTRVRYYNQGVSPNILGTCIWYSLSPTTGAGHTFTAGPFCTIAIAALSGATTGLDQQSGLTTTAGTLIQPGSITPTANGTFIMLVAQDYIGLSAPSLPALFTALLVHQYVPGAAYCYGIWYYLQNTAAAINPTTLIDPETFQECTIANFK